MKRVLALAAALALVTGPTIVAAGPAADAIAELEDRVAALEARVAALEGGAPSPNPTPSPSQTSTPTSTPSPVVTASPSPAATPTPAPTPTSTSGPFTRIFRDDFDRTLTESQWRAAKAPDWTLYPFTATETWFDTSRKGRYTDIASEHDGVLDLHLRTIDGQVRSVAPVPQPGGVRNQLYGKYVVRWKADAVVGYKLAWLLWPQSNAWPRDGEIDFPEGNLTSSNIQAYMHYQGAFRDASGVIRGPDGSTTHQDEHNTNVPVAGTWYTTAVEWTPTAVRFYLDGRLIGTSTKHIPNTAMRWVLQTETRLSPYAGPYGSGHVLVDWVEVWAYTP